MFLGLRDDGAVIFGFIVDDLIVDSLSLKLTDTNIWVHWAGKSNTIMPVPTNPVSHAVNPISASYDGVTRNRRIYRNAELVGSDTARKAYNPDSNDLYIGADNMRRNQFFGSVAEVRVWSNVALDQAILRQHACDHTGSNRFLTGHAFAPNLAVRLVFDRLIGQHVANTVTLKNGRVFRATRDNLVRYFPARTQLCGAPDED
eukprot:c14989_g1_i6.p1 GENE.c14989_g1_i6~~c14989_g1_i6.p1  ORF type:complete len:202 (+),score=33.78 c14989_g1_i6:302-907(+)